MIGPLTGAPTPDSIWGPLWEPVTPPAEQVSLSLFAYYQTLEWVNRYNRNWRTRLHLRRRAPMPPRQHLFVPSIPGVLPLPRQQELFHVDSSIALPDFGTGREAT